MSKPCFPSERPREDALLLSLDRLDQILTADSAGREQEWAEAVGGALAGLEATLRRHRAAARRPDGPLAEVDETRPTLARQADELRSDLDDFLQQLLALRQQVRDTAEAYPSGSVDFAGIRQQAEQFLIGLHEKRETETKLVLESVNTDIGTGD